MDISNKDITNSPLSSPEHESPKSPEHTKEPKKLRIDSQQLKNAIGGEDFKIVDQRKTQGAAKAQKLEGQGYHRVGKDLSGAAVYVHSVGLGKLGLTPEARKLVPNRIAQINYLKSKNVPEERISLALQVEVIDDIVKQQQETDLQRLSPDSKQIGLSNKQVKSALLQGNYNQLVRQQVPDDIAALHKEGLSDKEIDRLIDSGNLVKWKQLCSKVPYDTLINLLGQDQPESIRNAIMAGLSQLNPTNTIADNPIVVPGYSSERTPHLITYQNPAGELRLVVWGGETRPPNNADHFLGAGSFGVAQLVTKVAWGLKDGEFSVREKEQVIKTPKGADEFRTPAEAKMAQQDINNEVNKLDRIHQDGPVPGIQPKLRGFTVKGYNAVARTITTTTAHYGKKFDIDGSDVLGYIGGGDMPEIKRSHVLTQMQRIFVGVSVMHQLGIIHGDIKLENMLAALRIIPGATEDDDPTIDPDDPLTLVLGDFGGAKDKDEWKAMTTLGTVSREYLCENDINAFFEALNNPNLNSDQKNDIIFKINQARDSFAMGVALYLMLSGDEDYPFGDAEQIGQPDKGFLNPDFLNTIKENYGEETLNLMLGLLKPNYEDRILPQEASNRLQAVLNNPALADLLNNPAGEAQAEEDDVV